MMPRIRVHERHVLMWLLGATMVTIAGGALWLAVGHHAGHHLATGDAARVQWMRESQHNIVADYFDPSVMSLPAERGFSRAAWQRRGMITPVVFEPESAPAFLVLPVSVPLLSLLAEPELPELVRWRIGWASVPANEPVWELPATNSVLEITGALRDRRIVQLPVLPVADAPVKATRLLIAVNAEGCVRYAVLDRSSGNEALDSAAVAAARQVWFTPEPNADPVALTWGVVQLVWVAKI